MSARRQYTPHKRWTPEDIEAFAVAWQRGDSLAEIGAALGRRPRPLGVQRFTLHRAGDRRFAPRKPDHPHRYTSQRATWAGRLAAGRERILAVLAIEGRITVARMAERAGVSWRQARRVMLEVGAPHVPTSHRIAAMARDGLADEEIARTLGLKPKSVREMAARARRKGVHIPYEAERRRIPAHHPSPRDRPAQGVRPS